MNIFDSLRPYLPEETYKIITEFWDYFTNLTIEEWGQVLTNYSSNDSETIRQAEYVLCDATIEFLNSIQDKIGIPTDDISYKMVSTTYKAANILDARYEAKMIDKIDHCGGPEPVRIYTTRKNLLVIPFYAICELMVMQTLKTSPVFIPLFDGFTVTPE